MIIQLLNFPLPDVYLYPLLAAYIVSEFMSLLWDFIIKKHYTPSEWIYLHFQLIKLPKIVTFMMQNMSLFLTILMNEISQIVFLKRLARPDSYNL